jgi:SPP1 gp7 family putative phage head morphogenesis protein
VAARTQQEVLARIDSAARRALFAQEQADLQAILKLYDEAENEIASLLYSLHDSLERAEGEGDDQRVNYLQWKLQREERFAFQVRARLDRLRIDLTARLGDALQQQARRQAQYSAYGIDQATPPSVSIDTRALTPDAVDAIVNTPWEGAMFSHRTMVLTDTLARELQNVVANGVLLGKGTDEIVRDVRDARIGTVKSEPRYVIERIVRTEVLKAADRARDAVYRSNDDIVQGERIVATLDSRTDDGCADLDDLQLDSAAARAIIAQYRFNGRPPFHPNCRCTTAPVLRSWADLLGVAEMPDDLEDFEKEERMVRDPRTGRSVLVPLQSFNEWVAARSAG